MKNIEKKIEKEDSVTRKEFDDLASKVRRMSANWKKFAGIAIGKTEDGKIGNFRIAFGCIILVCCVTGIVFGRTVVDWSGGKTATVGTAKITTDDAGTSTLTVDATASAVNGAIGGTTPAAGTFSTLNVIAGSTTNNAILGANAVGVQVLECGTSTQGVAIAYGTVYTTAPKIVCTYQVDSGADTAIEIQSKNTTNFTITATAAKNIDWIAVGIK